MAVPGRKPGIGVTVLYATDWGLLKQPDNQKLAIAKEKELCRGAQRNILERKTVRLAPPFPCQFRPCRDKNRDPSPCPSDRVYRFGGLPKSLSMMSRRIG